MSSMEVAMDDVGDKCRNELSGDVILGEAREAVDTGFG